MLQLVKALAQQPVTKQTLSMVSIGSEKDHKIKVGTDRNPRIKTLMENTDLEMIPEESIMRQETTEAR